MSSWVFLIMCRKCRHETASHCHESRLYINQNLNWFSHHSTTVSPWIWSSSPWFYYCRQLSDCPWPSSVHRRLVRLWNVWPSIGRHVWLMVAFTNQKVAIVGVVRRVRGNSTSVTIVSPRSSLVAHLRPPSVPLVHFVIGNQENVSEIITKLGDSQ